MRGAEDYIGRIPSFTDKHTLEHTKSYYDALGIRFPEERIIHVAGTNGKGSVCDYMRRLLLGQGFCTVMFTSPHLVRLTERFIINDEEVSCELFLAAYRRVRELSERLEGREGLHHPTFFEFLFLMLMCICDEVRPDYLILETGLGGRKDCSNIFARPALTLITGLGLDHCRYLGNTLEEIAAEKGGIVKEGVPLVLLHTTDATDAVITKIAHQKKAPLHLISEQNYGIGKMGKKTVDFSFQSHYYNIGLSLHTGALYQIRNAAVALEGFLVLAQRDGFTVRDEIVREAFAGAHWRGRMDEVAPGIIADGAHNACGLEAFLASVAQDGCEGKRILVFALSGDKDAGGMTAMIQKSGLFEMVILTRYQDERAMRPGDLAAFFEDDGRVLTADNSAEALSLLIKNKKQQDLGYVAGSLYLVGEILRMTENGLDGEAK